MGLRGIGNNGVCYLGPLGVPEGRRSAIASLFQVSTTILTV